MSADTRLKVTTLVPKLCRMFANALDLIQKGARDHSSVERLLHAFQIFKDPNLVEQLPSKPIGLSEMHDRQQKLKEYVAKAGPECHERLYAELLKAVPAQAANSIKHYFPDLFLLLSAEEDWIKDLNRVTFGSFVKLLEALSRMGLHLNMSVKEICEIFPDIDDSNNVFGPDTIVYDYGEGSNTRLSHRFEVMAIGGKDQSGWGTTEHEALASFIISNPSYFRLRIKKKVNRKPPAWMQKHIDDHRRRMEVSSQRG